MVADARMSVAMDPESAFDLYMGRADRSYLKIAAITGVSLNTVRKWAVRYRWADQATAMDEHARRANRQHILSTLDVGMPAALKNIRAKMESTNDRVSLDASARWVDLWGKYRTMVDGDNDTDDVDTQPADVSDADLFTELKRRSTQ